MVGPANQLAPSGGPQKVWQPTMGMGWLTTNPLPCNRPTRGVARPCHPGRDEKTRATSSNAGWTGFILNYYFRSIHNFILVLGMGIKPCRRLSKLARMVGCHTRAGGPVVPQAPTTGWLGLATPVWLGYEGLITPATYGTIRQHLKL